MRTTLALSILLAGCNATPAPPPEPIEPASTLIVLNKSDATASLIDAETGETLITLPTGVGPHEVAVHGSTAVVSDYGDDEPGSTLTVLDVERGEVVRTIRLGRHHRPHGIQFEDDGRRVIVTAEDSRSLLRVDVQAGVVTDVWPTDQDVSHMVVLTPDRSRAFVANIGSGTVTAIDLVAGQVLAQIPTGQQAEGIAVTPDGSEIWVGNRAEDTITLLDARSLEVEGTLSCGQFPIRIAITPDGAHALVSNARSGDVAVFDVEGRRELRRISMGLTAAETEDRLFDDFGESPVPVGILVRPDGQRAYVADTNADVVTVIDLVNWIVVGRLAAGRQPDGLGWSTSAPVSP